MKALRQLLAGILLVVVSLLMAVARWLDADAVAWFVKMVIAEVVGGMKEAERE